MARKEVIPWMKIKAEYLQGATPKDLAEKYAVSPKTIGEKASKDKWVAEKTNISKNLQKDIQGKITKLTTKALEALSEVIDDCDSKPADRVAAARAILDVSGLKSLKQEVSGIEGVSVIINREAVHVENNN